MALDFENDRRKFFRVQLDHLPSANVSILNESESIVWSGSVLIKDISAEGLLFLTGQKLPISSNVVLEIDQTVQLRGSIVRTEEEREGEGVLYCYGVAFTLSD